MSLKINGFNISQMKINGYDIKLAKINGDIVFQKMILIKTFYGDSKQNTTTGKNLLPMSKIKGQTITKNGVTVTCNEDGSVLLNGTSTSYTEFVFCGTWNSTNTLFQLKSGATYSSLLPASNTNFHIVSSSSIKLSFTINGSYTLTEDINVTEVIFAMNTGVSFDNQIWYPMIFEGTYANKPEYEPYTGGIPSPNPDYPQEIQTIVGASLKLTGKNLFDYNYYFENYVNNGSQYSIYPCVLTLKPDISYTVSTNKDNGEFANIFAWSGSDITVSPGTTSNGVLSNSPRTITTDSNGKLVLSIRNIDTTSKDSFENGTIWVQIEEGTTATEYEIYKTQSIPTDLKGYVLAKVGDIADELKIYSNGDVSILKNIDKISNYNGETISTDYLSTTGELTTGATIYYVNNEPQTIALDNIKTQIDAFGTYSSMELEVTYGTEPIIEEVINLYPVQEEVSYTGVGGLDVTFADKHCLINGTSTSWGYYYTNEFVMNLEANKQYKFKLTLDSGSTDATDNIIIVELRENGTGIIDFVWLTTETVYNEITFTPSASNSTYVLFLNSIEGVTYNNWKVNISITEA